MRHWSENSIFYHIYPLGLCDTPEFNDKSSGCANRIQKIYQWLDPIQELGANAIYLGPVFESQNHGYDTSDYYQIDRRLGSNQDFRQLAEEIHRRGMRLVLDGVFNHVGREFWAFRDLQTWGQPSVYRDWFVGINFERMSPAGDSFDYATWEGHYSLPKLNLHHPDVQKHLMDAVRMWMAEFRIDGLRLDAADCVEDFFWKQLHQVTKSINPEFWLMGEIIHGDYRRWANTNMFDSVTNYQAYKGLWSSLNDGNYHEIAYTLDQQFGEGGMYRDLPLYNFVDNHDVSRAASQLHSTTYLYPLYLMLFTMPGVPSVYYGSEFGVSARKEDGDKGLRKAYSIEQLMSQPSSLRDAIQKFSRIRNHSQALQVGNYKTLYKSSRQFGFLRCSDMERIIVLFNSESSEIPIRINIPDCQSGNAIDLLNDGERFDFDNGELRCTIPPTWGRILRLS